MTGYQLVRLPNGAFSVHSPADRETFHPVAGPAAEAEALYVRQLRLPERMSACGSEFVIWDVGLGAAANPVTALRCTRDSNSPVRIVSFDRTTGALEFALQHTDRLDYLQGFEPDLRRLIEEGAVNLTGARRVRWELHVGDFPNLIGAAARQLDLGGERIIPAPHAIFYDAFSPRQNPEMWTLPVLKDVFAQLGESCSLATFSRSTITRATLLLAGFHVGTGLALAGKEETTVAANDPVFLSTPLDNRWLDRARRSHSAAPLLAGRYEQQPLSQESWEELRKHPQFSKTPGKSPGHN